MRNRTTIINGIEYSENNDECVFLVSHTKLGDFTPNQLPNNSSMHVTEMGDFDGVELYFSVTNGNSLGDVDYYSIFLYFSKCSTEYAEASRQLNEIANEIITLADKGYLDNPKIEIEPTKDSKWEAHLTYHMQSEKIGEVSIKELSEKLNEKLKNRKPSPRVFLCHSSSDKALVERFANRLKLTGGHVWFDKWEIKVGDSIVEKINDGLDKMSHLVVFLSKSSVNKPWVKKELSSALIKKLNDNAVRIMPIKVEDVSIPAIINDIKYADCSLDVESGFSQLINDIINWKPTTNKSHEIMLPIGSSRLVSGLDLIHKTLNTK
jgi:hypothetical protein